MLALIKPAVTAIVFVCSSLAMAQMDHSQHGSPTAASASKSAEAAMVEGLVKKVDKTKGTLTLAHGAMNGMPAMTMVYKVKEAAWLNKLQAGQKVRFATDPLDAGMTVTRFELIK